MYRVVQSKTLLFFRLLLITVALGLLAACSTSSPPISTPGGFHYVATVNITADASKSVVAKQYGGEVVVFRPEAGFAILGFSEKAGDMSTLAVESNRQAVASPIANAQGFSAWAGGFSAWAGGFSAWAGGVGASGPTTFAENTVFWNQIKLTQGQALATNLGEGVVVAVLDTGIDLSHTGFSGRLTNPSTWWDFVDNDAIPEEGLGLAHGHGTAAAGLILQVAPKAKIMPIRVLAGNGAGDLDAIAQAVDWAVSKGAHVINMSLGATVNLSSLQAVLDYAASQGVYVVASSGNTGDHNVTYPAANMKGSGNFALMSVGVGSVNALDIKSGFSTHGPKLEIVAPGDDVYTLYPGNQVTTAKGTSFAAPIVAGVVALALGEPLKAGANPAQAISSTADNVAALNPLFNLGHGRLNVLAAIQAVRQ